MVVFDIPTGIIADRVGRKFCLLAACVAQVLGAIIMAGSNSLTVYLIGTVIFGLYICLANGAAEALLYDSLAAVGKTRSYARQQGSVYAWWLLGAGAANVMSGFIAHYLSLRPAYLLSVIPGIVTFGLFLGLQEPATTQHRATAWYSHLHEVIGEIKRHRRILTFIVRFTASGIMLLTVGEFGQIYLLSFGISTVVLGIFWAITALSASAGRYGAHYLQRFPRLAILVFCALLTVFALVTKSYGIGLFWLIYGLNEAISNVAETEIQDATSSHIRATMFSVASFAGNAISIPVILWYNHTYLRHGIFWANRIIIVAVVGVLLLTLLAKTVPKHGSKAAVLDNHLTPNV